MQFGAVVTICVTLGNYKIVKPYICRIKTIQTNNKKLSNYKIKKDKSHVTCYNFE